MHLLYIEHGKEKESSLSNPHVRFEALKNYEPLCIEDNVVESEPFQANRGWLDKFILHQKLHNLKVKGEPTSAEHKAAAHILFIFIGSLYVVSLCARFSQNTGPA